MKLAGGLLMGPLTPNTAIVNFCPGLASDVSSTRFGALNPFTSWPPACPSATGSLPSTQISA